MANLAELEAAFIKADDAGNTEDAQAFATEIKRLRSQTSKPLAANAGLANFGASVLGLPMDTVQNVANLGIAGYGAAKTALTGKPGPELISGIPGGSENVRGMLRRTGATGLSPDNPNPESETGTLAYDLASRGGFIPGSALPAVGSIVAEKIGGPQWSGVGAMAPSAATAAFNSARAPSLARAQAQNTVSDATLRDAQEAGYVLPPSQVNPSFLGNRLEGLAGKAAINQDATIRNQQVTNSLARRAIGLPENAPLTEQTLNSVRTAASRPYQEVAALSPVAANALQRLRDARSEAHQQYVFYDRSATPEALRRARALDRQAEMLERVIDRQATSAGRPELVQQLRDARTLIAKTWDVERALNVGSGNIDAKVIGRALDRGRPLTGELATIGRFAGGPGTQFTREASAVPTPGVSALEYVTAAGLGVGGYGALGPTGAAMATLPLLRPAARATVLSDLYQRNFARPDYTPNMQPQGSLAALVQQAILANQQK